MVELSRLLNGGPGTVEVESAWVARARELALANTHISEARCGVPTGVKVEVGLLRRRQAEAALFIGS